MASSGTGKMGAEVDFSVGDVGESGAQTTAVESKLIETSSYILVSKTVSGKTLDFVCRLTLGYSWEFLLMN